MTTAVFTQDQVDSLLEAFEQLDLTSGANAKTAILRRFDSPLLRKVLLYALDPYRTYGVKVVEAHREVTSYSTAPEYVDWFFEALDQMAARTLSGKAAREELATVLDGVGMVSYKLRDVMARVLLKDLRCGVQEKTVNKVFTGLVPEFECALAKTLDRKKVTFPCLAEVKMNGKRLLAFALSPEDLRLSSRLGHEQHGYDHIRAELEELRDLDGRSLVFDGELMWGIYGDRSIQEKDAVYVVYDIMTYSEWENRRPTLGQKDRRYEVALVLSRKSGKRFVEECQGRICNDWKELEAYYNEVVGQGHEGLVVKDLKARYQFKRSWAWQKWKPVFDMDLEVVNVYEGTGKYVGMAGGIVVRRPLDAADAERLGRSFVDVGIGTGFDDHTRARLWVDRDSIVGQVAEIQYRGITPDGSLSHTNFVRIRDDK